MSGGASSITPLAVSITSREARLERAEVDAVRRFLQAREREPVGPAPEAVAVRPDPQQHVDDARRPDPAVHLRERSRRR